MIADRIRVASNHPDGEVQHAWESKNGETLFHIYEDLRRHTLGRDTKIVLFMKEDAAEHCDEAKVS